MFTWQEAIRSRRGEQLCKQGEYERAAAELAAVISAMTARSGAKKGTDHTVLIHAHRWHLHALGHLGRPAQAEADLRYLVAASARQLGPDHASTLRYRQLLVAALWEAGEHKAATAEMADVAARRTATLGAGHPEVVATLEQLAAMETDAEDLAFAFTNEG
jgi:eukaryotic-like serine/threonine-protein kinase